MTLSRARLQRLRALRTAKGRAEQRAFLLDGEKLVRDAIEADVPITEVLVTAAHQAFRAAGQPVTEISDADAERLSETRTPQGIFAVVEDQIPTAEAAVAALPDGPALALLLDGVQDPGNAGALVRVAAAFGVALVIAGEGSADPAHPRLLRAATGAWFALPVARGGRIAEDAARLRAAGFALWGASAEGESVYAVDPPSRLALVVGSEGEGLSPELASLLDGRVGVPMAAGVESLNVAVAAGIILGELARRRGAPGR